ncbi:MAG: hypothetical protein K0R09_1681 [Clostridiales bacterium]|jgi:hypothetical protein|nr:hypothetical protein [Clostridiales bacterium]
MKNKKIITYILLLIVGAALVYIGGFVITGLKLKSISGVCIGIGAGLFGMSIGQIIMIRITKKNPSYEHKNNIEVMDERNIYIRNTAKGKAFDVMGVALGILMLVYALINADLLVILLLVGVYLFIYGVYILYLSKYSKEM